ncbi:hypothetical protein GCM10028774_19130 [Spirosoma jeollabukense]
MVAAIATLIRKNANGFAVGEKGLLEARLNRIRVAVINPKARASIITALIALLAKVIGAQPIECREIVLLAKVTAIRRVASGMVIANQLKDKVIRHQLTVQTVRLHQQIVQVTPVRVQISRMVLRLIGVVRLALVIIMLTTERAVEIVRLVVVTTLTGAVITLTEGVLAVVRHQRKPTFVSLFSKRMPVWRVIRQTGALTVDAIAVVSGKKIVVR